MRIELDPCPGLAPPRPTRVTERWVLRLSCPDRLGIVAGVANALRDTGCNIVESAQFGDAASGNFFMRVCLEAAPAEVTAFTRRFREVAASFHMAFKLAAAHHRPKTLIMVSREGHCLHHILSRRALGDLSFDVALVVSNHDVLRAVVEAHGVPFVHLPIAADARVVAERRLRSLIDQHGIELIGLARYMQIMSPAFCGDFAGRVVNIHHSFLPSFRGAKPYHQAHALGVKLVGATAHFVTAELDCGPIIEQETIRIDHAAGVDQLIRRGRDIESVVLTRALGWVAEGRVMCNGHRTVVL